MKNKNIDIPLMAVSLVLILVAVAFLAIYPTQGLELIAAMFSFITNNFGVLILWFGIFTLVYCMYFAFSRHGKIKLGNASEKAEYSMFQYLSMMICAGLGSSTVIWSFVEWGYYYAGPAQGVEPYTWQSAEWATAYNFLHWTLIPWAMFAIAAIPVAYAFHVRKIPALRFSAICEEMLGEKSYTKPLVRLIDYFFVFCVVGGLSVTLGMGIPIIAMGLGDIFGFEPTFATNVIATVGIACVFSLSSFIGIDKGMKHLSSINIYIAIAFIVALLFTGPTRFILEQITTGLGLMVQNFVGMSTWTDSINQGGFAQSWTVFYYAFGIVYATLMALFITKISKGRTMKEMICTVIFGGSLGCIIFFGINGSFAMNLQLSGALDVVDILYTQGNEAAIFAVLKHTPFGVFATIIFVVVTTLFLSTSLDSAAFSLSATSTKTLTENDNTSPFLRLFWCITLALIPLCMNFIGASMSTLQTVTIIASLPFIFVIIGMTKGMATWLKESEK